MSTRTRHCRYLGGAGGGGGTGTTTLQGEEQQEPQQQQQKQQDTILPFMEPIHVLGAGSIGLLFASSIRMAFPSYPLVMLLRPHHEHRLQRERGTNKTFMEVCVTSSYSNSTNTTNTNTSPRKQRPRMVRIPAQIIHDTDPSDTTITNNKLSPIRNLLIATKAYDVIPAMTMIESRLVPHSSHIMILCNGALAVQDEINRHYFRKTNNNNNNNNHHHQQQQQHHDVDSHSSSLSSNDDDNTRSARPYFPTTIISTTHGAYRDNNDNDNIKDDNEDDDLYHVTHAGIGTTMVQNHIPLAKLLDQSGLVARSIGSSNENNNNNENDHHLEDKTTTPTTTSTTTMEEYLWKKLAANCTINPLTALWDIKNGQLLSESESSLMQKFHTEDDKPSPSTKSTTSSISWIISGLLNEISQVSSYSDTLTPTVLEDYVYQVIHDTSENTSSMLQDVQRGRKRLQQQQQQPGIVHAGRSNGNDDDDNNNDDDDENRTIHKMSIRTEIDYLNGYIVQRGLELGIPTPVNNEICQRIHQLQREHGEVEDHVCANDSKTR